MWVLMIPSLALSAAVRNVLYWRHCRIDRMACDEAKKLCDTCDHPYGNWILLCGQSKYK